MDSHPHVYLCQIVGFMAEKGSDILDRECLLTTTFLSFATSFLFKHPSLHSNSFQFLQTHTKGMEK